MRWNVMPLELLHRTFLSLRTVRAFCAFMFIRCCWYGVVCWLPHHTGCHLHRTLSCPGVAFTVLAMTTPGSRPRAGYWNTIQPTFCCTYATVYDALALVARLGNKALRTRL